MYWPKSTFNGDFGCLADSTTISPSRQLPVTRYLLPAFALLLALMARPTLWAAMSVTHRARAHAPGEVVELTVRDSEPLSAVEARVFGKSFPCYATKDSRIWQGLVGIDLDTKPGTYKVEIRAKAGSRKVTGEQALVVRPKSFPTRRLTVDEKFVTPPPEVGARIKREAERLAAIFGAESAARLWGNAFLAPVDAEPISSFGKRSILNGKPRSPHAGTDFNAPVGTPVHAPAGGRVVLSGDLYFSGNTVVLDHGLGLYSLFAHLSKISVDEGTYVKAGHLVGRVGSTGRSTGPHLHWSLRLVGTRVDPLSLVALTASGRQHKNQSK
jgi:murein DD-endopeptidase MepM/ murein hydrolase activator NlpD